MTAIRSFAGTQPAPEFPPLEWLNIDRPLRLSELRGKVVVLDFWTYGCINCIHVIPQLKRLEDKYQDELTVIGVHSAKFRHEAATDNIRQVIMRYGLEHPVVNDKDFLVWRMYGARAWPTLVIIDPAGNFVGKYSGETVYELFDEVIGALVVEFDARHQIDRRPLELKLENRDVPDTQLSFPGKVLADPELARLFIADTGHNRIVVVELGSTRRVFTAGVLDVIGGPEPGLQDGDFEAARLSHPQGMALSPDGNLLYIADTDNHALRQADLSARTLETIAGTGRQSSVYPGQAGPGREVELNSPWDLELIGELLFVAMAGPHQLWRMDVGSGWIEPWAGSGREGIDDGPLAQATLAQPSGITTDGSRLYFADSEASAIRVADLSPAGRVSTLAGTGLFDFGDEDGVGEAARLEHPLGVVFRPSDGLLYVADTYNSKIKTVDPRSRRVDTLMGDGHGFDDSPEPKFYEPGGIDQSAVWLFVADTNNHAIRVVDLGRRVVETLKLFDTDGKLAKAGQSAEEVVTAGAAEVREGEGEVRLTVLQPEDHHLDDNSPVDIEWEESEVMTLIGGRRRRRSVAPQFPLSFSVRFNEGVGTLSVSLHLYYCRTEGPGLCQAHRTRLQVPVKVVADSAAPAVLKIEYLLPPLPDWV